jgi:hypothetical protein
MGGPVRLVLELDGPAAAGDEQRRLQVTIRR